MHSVLLLTPLLIFASLLAFAVPVVLRLLRPCPASDLTPEWLENLDASSYAPMHGLLAPDDFKFLASQPGFDSSLRRKLRRDRLRIFRQYLDRLVVDFNRLHKMALTVVASDREEDRSDLLIRLIKLRLRFSVAVLQVEFCYLLCRFGMSSLSVDLLLQRFDEMTAQFSASPLAT